MVAEGGVKESFFRMRKRVSVQCGFVAGVLGGLCGMGCNDLSAPSPAPLSLRVMCGSSMATPVQEIGRAFTEAQGVRIELDLGGSETLLPKLLAGARADVFVCHDPFEDKLKAAGLWTNSVGVGYLEPVLAVRPGNPQRLRSVQDLTRPGLKIGLGDPRYSTCGELFVRALRERALEADVMRNVVLQARSHGEMANGLIVGSLDAAVVWNFVTGLYPGKLEVVPSGLVFFPTRVTVVGLTAGEHPEQREAFLAWCRQPAAQDTFQRYGYKRVEQ